jgi:hypothetical protein
MIITRAIEYVVRRIGMDQPMLEDNKNFTENIEAETIEQALKNEVYVGIFGHSLLETSVVKGGDNQSGHSLGMFALKFGQDKTTAPHRARGMRFPDYL